MITKERIKELKEERKDLNMKIKDLTRERVELQDIQRKCKVRTWRIREILNGEIEDEA